MNQKGFVPLLVIALITIIAGAGGFYLSKQSAISQIPSKSLHTTIEAQKNQQTPSADNGQESLSKTPGSKPDLENLPLGDNKISKSAQKGYIYLCRTQSDGGGAFEVGPWINQTEKTWNFSKKLTVDGNVAWPNSKLTVNVNGQSRSLSGNGLPSHNTGVYPISSTDDAYQYDRNPNSIKEQTLSLNLPANPSVLTTPECVGGEVGIMLSGIPLFNGFDAASRDAAAYEVQDKCSGHPQVSGLYHYHSPSKCLNDDSKEGEHSALVGYAFDGFGIYGLRGENGIEVSTDVLDECHGHTHGISWDGSVKSMYHYHLTYDFPYSVGCFKGKKSVQGPLGGAQQGQANSQPPGGNGGRMPMNGFPPPPPPR